MKISKNVFKNKRIFKKNFNNFQKFFMKFVAIFNENFENFEKDFKGNVDAYTHLKYLWKSLREIV